MTALRRAVEVSLLALLGTGLAACTQPSDPGADEGAASAPSSTAPPAPSASSSSGRHQEGTPIRITVGDQTLEATVGDTPTGRALVDQLPLTLDFEDLNGQEKVGHLEEELPMDGMPEGDDPVVGDLGYYAPWGNVVLYYGDVDYWDGIARIGQIHGDLSVISDQTEDFTATLERVD